MLIVLRGLTSSSNEANACSALERRALAWCASSHHLNPKRVEVLGEHQTSGSAILKSVACSWRRVGAPSGPLTAEVRRCGALAQAFLVKFECKRCGCLLDAALREARGARRCGGEDGIALDVDTCCRLPRMCPTRSSVTSSRPQQTRPRQQRNGASEWRDREQRCLEGRSQHMSIGIVPSRCERGHTLRCRLIQLNPSD
jgi:hypothetical protein